MTYRSIGEPVTQVVNALAVPAHKIDARRYSFTLVDELGAPIASASDVKMGMMTPHRYVDRSIVKPEAVLKGAYLYAGTYWSHFGHFLFESITRLWAYDALKDNLSGIIFNGNGRNDEEGAVISAILETLGIELPRIFITKPTEIEHLYVPRQGCGLGGMAMGTPTFRAFIHQKFGQIEPKGNGAKLYLTREGYGQRRGGMFGEEVLRQRLEDEGYVSFAPEQHSFADQVATYRGASKIVGPDSSAMHLVGYAIGAKTDVCIILRRKDDYHDFLDQFAGFTGRAPLIIDAIDRMMVRDNPKKRSWSEFADINLAQVGSKLRETGFLSASADWHALEESERRALHEEHSRKLKCNFITTWERNPEALAPAKTDQPNMQQTA